MQSSLPKSSAKRHAQNLVCGRCLHNQFLKARPQASEPLSLQHSDSLPSSHLWHPIQKVIEVLRSAANCSPAHRLTLQWGIASSFCRAKAVYVSAEWYLSLGWLPRIRLFDFLAPCTQKNRASQDSPCNLREKTPRTPTVRTGP